MIIEAYVPTRDKDFVVISIISSSSQSVRIRYDDKEIILKNPGIQFRRKFFLKTRITGLIPGTNYTFYLNQDSFSQSVKLNTQTLPELGKKRLFRFGILADCHLNNYQNNQELPEKAKRIYSKAEELCTKYIDVIKKSQADFIVFPGDLMDYGSFPIFKQAKKIISKSGILCYIISGNHEPYGKIPLSDFFSAFNIPGQGYYAITRDNHRLIFLHTPNQTCLDPGTEQLEWLEKELDNYADSHNILLFSHFSLILHPCVQGIKNDGLQQIYNHHQVLTLLEKYQNVRAFIAGHKNVPSKIMQNGIMHLLTTQLIQAPCSYDLIDVYDNCLVKTTHEIDELHYLQVSRNAFGHLWPERYGEEGSRNFILKYSNQDNE